MLGFVTSSRYCFAASGVLGAQAPHDSRFVPSPRPPPKLPLLMIQPRRLLSLPTGHLSLECPPFVDQAGVYVWHGCSKTQLCRRSCCDDNSSTSHLPTTIPAVPLTTGLTTRFGLSAGDCTQQYCCALQSRLLSLEAAIDGVERLAWIVG
ncbi:hypothetical protein GWK47_048228 [Chionoecetes opilio]|uniref:Uncharacterized protein n=1 Tax=Chionoecetes opilio TaxID=41210 RepID=A0A8J5CUC6_CHIOP|nr:hypothetical protein GWK47_048228 [Chionoecetes opilio]